MDRPNEWIFGPEYVFHTNLTYLLSDVLDDPLLIINVTSTMRCRPEAIDRLYCRFEDVAIAEKHYPETSSMEYSFLIEFSPRGIESLRLPTMIEDEQLNIIRSIVKELSIGTDLRENMNSLPVFFARERYALGECPTLFNVFEYDEDVVTRGQRRNDGRGEKEERKNYELEILSLPQRRSNSVVVIGKTMESKRCMKLQEPVDGKSELNVKIVRICETMVDS